MTPEKWSPSVRLGERFWREGFRYSKLAPSVPSVLPSSSVESFPLAFQARPFSTACGRPASFPGGLCLDACLQLVVEEGDV